MVKIFIPLIILYTYDFVKYFYILRDDFANLDCYIKIF